MEETALNKIDEEHKIVLSASWKEAHESINGHDSTYNIFCQVMHERREVAKKYLSLPDGKTREITLEIFKEYNNKIKQILGL